MLYVFVLTHAFIVQRRDYGQKLGVVWSTCQHRRDNKQTCVRERRCEWLATAATRVLSRASYDNVVVYYSDML